MTADGNIPLTYPEEPLALSAPLARHLARELCGADPEQGGCAWYHGFWQYLRLLDFVTTPRDHAQFYRRALMEQIVAGARRVLISGTADYGLPACMLWIFETTEARPDLTVLDLCPTPLRLSEWYGQRVGVEFRTVAQDILAFSPNEPFDIIVTHSFLGRFAPEQRPMLLGRWHQLLRPGGVVVMVNRVRSDASDKVRFSSDQADGLVARVSHAARTSTMPLELTENELVEMAQAYIAAKRTFPVRKVDEIGNLFEAAGFHVVQLDVGPVGSRGLTAPSGPTMSGGANYARVVAKRP